MTCETQKFVLRCGPHDSVCRRYHEYCHRCDYDGVTCLECLHNMFLHNGTCVETCPQNFVENERDGWSMDGRLEIFVNYH